MKRSREVYSIGFDEEKLCVEGDEMVYELNNENGDRILLQCNVDKREMEIQQEFGNSTAGEIVLEKDTVIDLDNNGERWEGDSLNGRPFGYGKLYGNNNELKYNGYMFEGKKVCYGDTYSYTGEVEYSGYFLNDKKHGKGKFYDMLGSLIFEGIYHFGECSSKLVIPSNCNDNRQFTDSVEELVIEANCYRDLRSLHFTNNHILKRLNIGNKCFSKVNEFEIRYCSELESVLIGEESFMNNEDDEESGRLIINDCERLELLEIGDKSFHGYTELFDLKSIIMAN